MTRAERRRVEKEKEKSGKVYTFTAEMLEKTKLEATEKACETAFVLMLGLPLIVLHDRHEWGKKRLERFGEAVFEQYKLFQDGNIKLEEIVEIIEKETGMKLEGLK